MKKLVLFLLTFSGVVSHAQNNSGYDYVVLSNRFDFLTETNQYNLNELAKFLIAKKGFSAYFYTEDKPIEYHFDPCKILKMDITKEKFFLGSKIKITLKDCNETIIAESQGTSKEKLHKTAYNYALREAFNTLYIPAKKIEETIKKSNEPKDPSFLYAIKNERGYILYDSEENEKYTLFKTSKNDQFIVSNQEIQGALYKSKNNEWILEYLKDQEIVSEILKVKF